MGYFLTGLLAAMIGGCFATCIMAALCSSSRSSHEDEQSGVTEGAHPFNFKPEPQSSSRR